MPTDGQLNFDKGAKNTLWGKTEYSINANGKTRYPVQKNETEPLSYKQHTKSNSKCSKDLKLKPESIKLLVEITGEGICDIDLSIKL